MAGRKFLRIVKLLPRRMRRILLFHIRVIPKALSKMNGRKVMRREGTISISNLSIMPKASDRRNTGNKTKEKKPINYCTGEYISNSFETCAA